MLCRSKCVSGLRLDGIKLEAGLRATLCWSWSCLALALALALLSHQSKRINRYQAMPLLYCTVHKLQGRFNGCHTKKRPCAIEHPLPVITPDSTTDIPSSIPHTPALEMPMHVMLVMAARRIGWHAAAQRAQDTRE